MICEQVEAVVGNPMGFRSVEAIEMRLIQVGVGGFGRSWAELARNAPGTDLVAVVDRMPEARAWAAATLGLDDATTFSTLEDALAEVGADAALVVTPPDTHHAIAAAALRAGLDVLLEKPLATTLAEARDLIEVAAANGRTLMVSQNYRFQPAVAAARQVVRDGVLGELAAVRVRCLRDTRGYWPADSFRCQMRHPFVLDMGIHHVDLLRAVTGQEVGSLYAQGWRVPDSDYVHDPAVAATLTLTGGATVLYEGDWATREPDTSWNGDWTFLGARGRLTWADDPEDRQAGTLTLRLHGKEPRNLDLPEMALTDRAAALAHFRKAIATGTEPETSARDNIRSLALVLAMAESVETCAVVVPRG